MPPQHAVASRYAARYGVAVKPVANRRAGHQEVAVNGADNTVTVSEDELHNRWHSAQHLRWPLQRQTQRPNAAKSVDSGPKTGRSSSEKILK